jgi:hypothetical protein
VVPEGTAPWFILPVMLAFLGLTVDFARPKDYGLVQ